MSDHPLLIDVPFSPSPELLQRQLEAATLERVKASLGILTHHNPDCDPPWLAVAADRGETRTVAQLMAEECRYLEEMGRTEEAESEMDAVLGLVRRTFPSFDLAVFERWEGLR